MKRISNKQKITMTLDTEIYFKLKTSDLNASEMFNNFLKNHFKNEETSEKNLINEVEEKKRELIVLEYELKKRQEQRKKEEETKLNEEEQEKAKLIKSIPTGKDFYSKLIREKMLKEHPELKKYVEEG